MKKYLLFLCLLSSLALGGTPAGLGLSNVATIAAAAASPPVANTDPVIASDNATGTLADPVQGDTLTVTSTDFIGSGISLTYQWQRNAGAAWINVVGATTNSRTLTAGDVGCVVRCDVTATNAGGYVTAHSNQSGSVDPPALTFPTLAGNLVALYRGDAITGVADGDPIATWPDLSGNSNTLTASGSPHPAYVASLHNSRPGIRTNGSTNRVTGTFSTTAGSDYVSFHVYRYHTTWAAQRVAVDSGSDLAGALYAPAADSHRFYNSAFLGPWSATDSDFVLEIIRSNGASSYVRKNGVQVASGTITTALSGLTIGATAGNSQFAAVESLLHGVAKYDGSTDASANADIAAIEEYALAYANITSDYDPPYNVVCMGNSQTACTGLDPAARWTSKLKVLLGADFIVNNLGVDSLATGSMAGLLPAPAAGKINIIVAAEQTNDKALNGASNADCYAHLAAFCDAAYTAGYDYVIVWGVMPRNAPWAMSGTISSSDRAAINALNADGTTGLVAAGHADTYLPFAGEAWMADNANGDTSLYFDGTHETEAVCTIMASAFEDAIYDLLGL